MDLPVVKQLCVNQLALPIELLNIIKSYAFNDTIIYTSKMRKKTIHTLIQCTRWSGQYRYKPKSTGFLFWIKEDVKCRQFQMYFCRSCGNYTDHHHSRENDKIECKCNLI
jgi:hypothetical protein